jgi:putative addiction module CopG family antidote
MSILSVSLTPELEEFIENEVNSGEFESKGQVVKKALKKLQEDLIVTRVLAAEEEIKNGKGVRGDLRKLIKKI